MKAAEAWRRGADPGRRWAAGIPTRTSEPQLQPALSAPLYRRSVLSAGATHRPLARPRRADTAPGTRPPCVWALSAQPVRPPRPGAACKRSAGSSSLEVWAYHDAVQHDAITERLRRLRRLARVARLDDEQPAGADRQLTAIDILVDLHGHQPDVGLAVFARRCRHFTAEVGWLGHADNGRLKPHRGG